mmetsp:Transcript_74283/g.176977  ORF Transcript_74283/g.176977 Transcript_74283/m.176977 type:complete len:570 (+) Transcript_74283:131-1840(+)|eukprot:CAMPEP_0178422228 /NCGR_PEP_ID=MMETSP0689_2-20121128/27062_1 /TAXON_ID=160604 /ORGANISM="Amphidinium massartii, Strain CS-259" /LENGTH=569 /DNA_ID=CAMNT_0020043779 /DNA_START=26 /DNA_END=1735 /DNA_ORIENTATION=+
MLRKCLSPWCVIPLAIVACPCVVIWQQGFQVGLSPVAAGVLYQSQREVLDGEPSGRAGRGLGGLDDLAVGLVHSAKVCLGQRYLNPALKMCEGWEKVLGQEEEEAEGAQFCRSLLGYMWSNPLVHGLSYPNVFADSNDVTAWVEACKKELPSMSAEERKLLDPWLAANASGVPMELLIPEPYNHTALFEKSHAQPEKPIQNPPCDQYSSSEIKELVMKSLAGSIAGKAGILEPSSSVLKYWEGLTLCKPNFIEATVSSVRMAVEEGVVASFDARPFLPDFLVNITPQDMAALEGEAASRIPVFHDGARSSSFQQFADEQAEHFRGDGRYGSLHDLAMPAFFDGTFPLLFDPNLRNHSPWVDEWNTKEEKVRTMLNMTVFPSPFRAGYINARRLPQLYTKLPDITKRLGIDQDVLRTETLFWMGGTPGGLHYDEEQNFYVQLAGETFAFVVPQNFTDYWQGGDRHPQSFPSEGTDVPIFLIHMQPGDGLVFPGRTYHRFYAQSPNRLSLNWFFVPKWRAMEYHEADWYALEAKASLERLALRQHWARSFARLYDDTGKGIVFMGNKLEYI